MVRNNITQRGDTISLNIQGDFTNAIGNGLFQPVGDISTGEIDYYEYHNPLSPLIGLNNIDIVHERHIDIEISGKILGENYKEGICSNTLPYVVDKINDMSGIGITIDDILTKSVVKKYDSTYNIEVDEKDNIKDYISSLYYSSVGGLKAYSDDYGEESVIFGKRTQKKQRMIFYDKLKELQSPKNRTIFTQYKDRYYTDFQGVLRVENNIANYSILKRLFEIEKKGGVTLAEIFNSKVNTIKKQLTNFIDVKTSQKVLFKIDDMDSMLGFREAAKRFYIKELLKTFKGDVPKVQKVIQQKHFKGDIGEVRKLIKELGVEYKQSLIQKKDRGNYSKKFEEVIDKINQLK